MYYGVRSTTKVSQLQSRNLRYVFVFYISHVSEQCAVSYAFTWN